MASKQISPAAQLLRHSKLFSVPDPIKKPAIAAQEGVARHESETATPHYPTHASIITSNPGRRRGDWGLKRNLPVQKTGKRANPIIQVKSVDNIDHYTDYRYGTPHSISLRKFQEMNIPIVKHNFDNTIHLKNITKSSRSVFDLFEPDKARETTLASPQEPENAALSSVLTADNVKIPRRWKFRGPWLAGMDEHEFQMYLEKQVKPHRAEFKNFLWSWMVRKKQETLQAEKLNSGALSKDQSVSLTEEEYEKWLVELRSEGIKLYDLMWEFLDLPGKSPSQQNDQSIGPPTTHPSGGLSYLRTGNVLQNHPALGPVSDHQPVAARYMAKGRTNHIPGREPVVGIGGFVSKAKNVGRDVFKRDRAESLSDTKVYVRPVEASVDERGRTNINFESASKDSVALWEGEYEQQAFEQDKRETLNIEGFERSAKNPLFVRRA